jgi:hypothetical protein
VVIFIFGGFAQADAARLVAISKARVNVNNCFVFIFLSPFNGGS